MSPGNVDVNAVLGAVQGMLRRLIAEHITIEVQATPGLWVTRIDPSQLEQVIMNLAVNAADAIGGRGVLTFETANVVLNSCLATMANMLEQPLNMSLPQVVRGAGAGLFELDGQHGPEAVVLFLYINFAINDRDIRGYIAMLMDLPSIDALRGLIRDFIAKVVGDERPTPAR